MKIALGEIPPWTFRTICLLFGGVGILGLAKARGLSIAIPPRELRFLLLVASLNVTGWHVCSAYGIFHMRAGRASIIAFTMPLWAAILGSLILKERLNLERWVGLGLGLTGLIILIGPDIKVLGTAPLGALFMLAAAISWAGGTVFIKYFSWTVPTAVLTGWQLILGGIPVVIGAMTLEAITPLFNLSWRASLALIYIIMLPMIFCQWAWFTVVRLFPASVAAIGTLAIPVIGVFSSSLVLGEPVGLQELCALFFVVTGLAIVLLKPQLFRRGLK
jgi:drug/metabolite transporter (DMT)-like permease